MSWTMTREDCDLYYLPNNHIKSYSWRKYSDDEKDAAFNQAIRELQITQGRELEDQVGTSVYRDDYAVAEQALFILENTPRKLADGSDGIESVQLSDNEKTKTKLEVKGIGISPEALRFMAVNRLKMVRGG